MKAIRQLVLLKSLNLRKGRQLWVAARKPTSPRAEPTNRLGIRNKLLSAASIGFKNLEELA
jgi:hypothetical protein